MRGPCRPRLKIAGTVRARVVELFLGAFATERAFEGTDHCTAGIGKKVLVATFAIRSHLKHGKPPVVPANGAALHFHAEARAFSDVTAPADRIFQLASSAEASAPMIGRAPI